VFLRDRQNGIHIGRAALDVHGDDGLRSLIDGGFKFCRIDAISPGIDIHKNRNSILVQRTRSRGEKREGGSYDFVSRRDTYSGKRHVQSRGTAARRKAIFCADILRPLFLESLHLWRRAAGQDAAVQDLVNQAAVVGRDDRPVAVVTSLDHRGSTVDGQLICR
jgi:hypothetical protein